MRFRVDQIIEGARDEVEAALVDPAFLDTLASFGKIGAPEVLGHEDDGGAVRRRVRYRFTGDLNAAVRRMVDPTRLTWVEESTFDRATHRVDARIVPDSYGDWLTARYATRFDVEGDDRTRRVVEGDVTVHLPIVGRKVEGAIVSGLREHAEAEAVACARWLGRSAR